MDQISMILDAKPEWTQLGSEFQRVTQSFMETV